MRAKYVVIGVVLGVLLSSAVVVLAGNLDPPSGPADAASQMVTLEQIYARLDTGAAGTKMTSFTEPLAGPGIGTMHTLDDIMGIAPAEDNTDGALPAEVLAGKTFWSLRTNSAWGAQAGTMPNNGAVTYTPGTTDQLVAAGYHNGSGEVEGDADLLPGNIVSGVGIFGVTGAYPPAPLPETGQTDCYKSDGNTRSCTCGDPNCPSRQDGALQKGVAWPDPRFTDNGNGTVTDNLTGLIWLEDASCTNLAGTDAEGRGNWATAISAANALAQGTCGLSDGSDPGDWRLPNVRELHSLIDYGQVNPALPSGYSTFFTGVQSDVYWTSTTYADFTSFAWHVRLYDGYVHYGSKALTYYVWPVRGGQ